jgi:hypothetical protein
LHASLFGESRPKIEMLNDEERERRAGNQRSGDQN